MKPSVSVVMPAYNAAATLAVAVSSVLAQSFADLELIIVDDCSTDATRELTQEFVLQDSRVRVVRHRRNEGVARARNSALEIRTGAFIAFLDSDDLWMPDKLDAQIREMADDTGMSYMAYQHVDAGGTPGRTWLPPLTVNYNRALLGNPIGTLTVLVDDRLLGKHRFPERGHEDYALWLMLLRAIPFARRVGGARPYAMYRTHAASLSGSKLRAMRWQWDIYRNQESLSSLRAISSLSAYFANGVRKHYF